MQRLLSRLPGVIYRYCFTVKQDDLPSSTVRWIDQRIEGCEFINPVNQYRADYQLMKRCPHDVRCFLNKGDHIGFYSHLISPYYSIFTEASVEFII